MEWVRPIDEIEADFRRHGSFLLVGADGKLRYYACNGNKKTMDKLVNSIKFRHAEMINFLNARATCKG